jgi:hypothetical protein
LQSTEVVNLSFFRQPSRFIGPAVLALAAAVALAPLLKFGAACGSDLIFHLASWMEARNSMLAGIPYPHWAPQSNFGAGEPRFVFYPPLSWMAGAFLGLFLPWKLVAAVFTFLILTAIGLANRALALEWMEDGPATLAGCAAIFSGYPLLNFYVRSDFAELAGGIWIPLMLLFLLRDRNPSAGLWRRALDRSTVGLAITVAGVWLTNGPAGLMASYLLAAVAVTLSVGSKSWAPLLRASIAGALGLGLAGDFLVPAAWEQSWANLRIAVSIPHYLVQNSWLFARHADSSLTAIGHDRKLFAASCVAVGMVVVALGGAAIAFKRGTLPGPRRWWIPLALIPCAVLFLLLPASFPLWNTLPRMLYLQFPWRWLLVLEPPTALFFAAAVWYVPPRRRIAVIAACAVLFLGLSAGLGMLWFYPCGNDQNLIVEAEKSQLGVYGKPEYAPPGGLIAPVRINQPNVCLVPDLNMVLGREPIPVYPPNLKSAGCGAGFQAALYPPEHKRVAGFASRSGWLILKIRSYPAWRVTLNGTPVQPIVESSFGLIAVPVEKGPVNLHVDWTTTPDVLAGRWITSISLFLLTALWLLERKLSKPHLS